MSDPVSYKDLYEAIQQSGSTMVNEFTNFRVEVKEDITHIRNDVGQLRGDFMTMEKGRLTAAERKLDNLENKLQLMGARNKGWVEVLNTIIKITIAVLIGFLIAVVQTNT